MFYVLLKFTTGDSTKIVFYSSELENFPMMEKMPVSPNVTAVSVRRLIFGEIKTKLVKLKAEFSNLVYLKLAAIFIPPRIIVLSGRLSL